MANSSNRPSVVIVGAGFGGLAAAQRLAGQFVDVTVVDSRGAVVRRFAAGEASSEHRLVWDGRTDGGVRVAAGTYRVVARAGGQMTTTPVVIAR